jgi:myo-inositol 2-dehydrogenase/D-chiro-inositol 1-dehydrogenase
VSTSGRAASEPVRLCVVGAGRMGRVHLEALAGSDTVAPVAVVEPVDALRAAATAGGLTGYADLDAALGAEGIDAFLVAAPSDVHGQVVARIAAAGFPILCEKPCGLTAADARAAADAAERAGVPLQIGYWRRFVPELADVRARIAAGELGTVALVSCWQWDREPPTPAFRARSGGIAVDMGVHEIDQLRWLTGQEMEQLAAVGGGKRGQTPFSDPDAAAVVTRLSGGALGVITLGRRFPLPDSCWAEVIATEGHARLPFMWGAEGDAAFRAALRAQAEAFAATVRDGTPVAGAGGEDAARALEAAERIGAALAAAAADR